MTISTCRFRLRGPGAAVVSLASILCILLGGLIASCAGQARPDAPAEFVVTDQILRPAEKVPPLGANGWGKCGSVEFAANNFVHNAGNEPIHRRELHRVAKSGPGWIEIDGAGTSWFDLYASGLLSGASVRIYRLVDKAGNPLPAKGDYLDITRADHVILVGKAQVLPEGSEGFPDGGWVVAKYCSPYPNGVVGQGNLRCTDNNGIVNGRQYFYMVTALGTGRQESGPSREISVTPRAGANSPPRIMIHRDGDKLPELKPGAQFGFTPRVIGGVPPYRWEVLTQDGRPTTFPASLNLKFDPKSGSIAGKPQAGATDLKFQMRVTDSKGQSDTRWYVINSRAVPASDPKAKLLPPTDLTAEAADGYVTLSWKPSPSPGVTGYRVRRSPVPAARQEQRVYFSPGAPPTKTWDYVVFDKQYDNFDLKYVNPRVRGIGNPMDLPGWYWDVRPLGGGVSFSLVAHPRPVPSAMFEPGETCLKIQAKPGKQSIMQFVFIGTNHGRESVFYGQFEPGKHYRLEVWLRQEGLGNGGEVTFSYGTGYPDIKKTFHVTNQWAKYVHEWVGPERPTKPMHFGHTFSFQGPGALWMDSAWIGRIDRPEDAREFYVPNATVLSGLLAAQPERGPKGAHRIWFLDRDAPMSSILSWFANSKVNPDWATRVSGTMEMTVPMGLMFDLATGPDPSSRMKPHLVLQHLLHSEQDWLNFVEYMAAPYDPARDTPESKPWAYKRYRQRGVGTPWTEEFSQITVELGNETWHNGVFPDWLGFSRFMAVHQGGPEYGLFARYLIDNMKTSPYWKAGDLDRKLVFCLGANYSATVGKDGKIAGYGEEAMQNCPDATRLGHANYVGPKWETHDKALGKFDDHGMQGTLLGFVAGVLPNQMKMSEAKQVLERTHRAYDIVAYEGGPGGYALPGRDTAAQREINEKYGKSLAMAVGVLDSWLLSYQYGWTDQCFLGYGQGTYWNSHTALWDGFRPCPAWEVLSMRNRLAPGGMMAVETVTTPTLTWDKKVQPLVGAYAFNQGRNWTVIVVSRKIDGRHDDHDFGDGTTPVRLRLPFGSARKITLHKLTGDPRASNIEKMTIAPRTVEIPADRLAGGQLVIGPETGGAAGGLPPGSIFFYVIEKE
ncbi:MAG: hypothetical protein ACP5XB_03090 [Isosphaeraceae bacterium]